MFDEISPATVFDQGMSALQATGKGIHPADMGVEEILWLEAFATWLGIEIQSACGESTHEKELDHDLRRHVDVRWELIRVPTDECVTSVGIDRAKRSCGAGHRQIMLHSVTCERGVVGFDV